MMNQSHPETWHTYAFRAMGSHIVLWLDTADKAAATNAFAQAEALFTANEQALSRFRPDSELSRFNARSGEWVVVSDLLWQEITLAVQMAMLTNGRFDPTLLHALAQAGYDQSFDTMINYGGNCRWLEADRLVGQWESIEFDDARQAVRVPTDVHLDLGGIAKGDTAQQAMSLLQHAGPCLVDAGGDLVAGMAPVGVPGWPVAISTPWTGSETEQQDLAAIWVAEGALATSGIDYRNWLQNGTVMHHLIDPLTGSPAQTDGLTVTILAAEAAVAEAWATATLIAGSIVGMESLLDEDLAGLMITQNGRVLVSPRMDQHLQGKRTKPIANRISKVGSTPHKLPRT